MSRSTFILIPSHFGKNLKMFDFKRKKTFYSLFQFQFQFIFYFQNFLFPIDKDV